MPGRESAVPLYLPIPLFLASYGTPKDRHHFGSEKDRIMAFNQWRAACACGLAILSLAGCKSDNMKVGTAAVSPSASPAPPKNATASPAALSASPEIEKVKPAPGEGNVQGKVMYDSKPVANIEVKLCEDFSQYVGGCSGKIYKARTDKTGEYVIANVEPKTYQGLLARVFDTDSFIFATTGIGGLSTHKYEVTANKTLFVPPTNLFKGDLKPLAPKAGAKVGAKNLTLQWKPYPDAKYYKFSVFPEDFKVTSPYINERTEETSFSLDKPLPKGAYRWQVEAYNDSDQKLAESPNDIKFTLTEAVGP
jgi:hypothetical protein